MVKKLLKHEFYALSRTILPAAGILLALSIVSALSTHLQFKNEALEIFEVLGQGMLVSMFVIALAVVSILTYVVCIKRFYDSMFSKQGYLTMSLPVKPMELLFAKLVAAVSMLAFAFVVSAVAGLSFCLIAGVDVGLIFTEIGEIFQFLLEASVFGVEHIVLAIVLALVSAVSQLLFIYACIAATQLTTSHRGIIGVAIYFGANQIWNALNTMIFTLIAAIVGTAFQAADGAVLLQLVISLVMETALGVASVFFIRYILRNKVNIIA